MRLLRRFFPPAQEARCLECGELLRERRRQPCPVCGCVNRIHVRTVDMGGLTVRDRMG